MGMPSPDRTEISTTIQVMYFDTDAAGVVHNIVYLRFIETARTLLAMQLGMSFEAIKQSQIHPVVTRTEIDYLRPALLGDVVEVRGRIAECSRVRFWCEFEIIRPADAALLVTCRQTLALVQMPDGKPVRLPPGFPDNFAFGAAA
jgi:YbgC/YbaW family acyl-CoA thioester hydrolase